MNKVFKNDFDNDEKEYTIKELDMMIGDLNELYIKDIICKHFNLPSLTKTGSFSPLDFYSDNIYFEVKSRNNNHNTYPTTIVGYNKIKWIQQENIKDVYFVFVFIDGDYYYKYNPDDKFLIKLGGRKDRGKIEQKLYYNTPSDKLLKFNN